MKFTTGLLVGAAAGGYLVYNMTPQQRDRVASTTGAAVEKVRSSSVAKSLSNNIGDVAGAASHRVADVVDVAGSAITDVVGPSDESGGEPSVVGAV